MSRIPQPFEVYRHFKGNYYQILTVAEHSETGEKMVVYQQLYSPFKTFVRPLAMFISPVDKEKYPNAEQQMRFELQTTLRNAQNDGLYEEYKKKDAEGSGREEVQLHAVSSVDTAENAGAAVEIKTESTAEEEPDLHPVLVQFLDADTYEEKLEILSRLHREITDEMINTIAVSLDLEVKEGDIEDRYREVLNCLITLEKFECNRLR